MGLPDGVRNGVKNLVRSPVIGQGLYYLNTTPSFLRLMYKRHVYVDETKLTPEFIAQKHQITSKEGARYAPAAFVTGALSPYLTRHINRFGSYSLDLNRKPPILDLGVRAEKLEIDLSESEVPAELIEIAQTKLGDRDRLLDYKSQIPKARTPSSAGHDSLHCRRC